LVFLTFLFNAIEKETSEKILRDKPPKEQKPERKLFEKELWKLFLSKTLPITIIFFVIFYSLLPKAFHIVTKGTISFWQFDVLNTIFVFIELGFLGITIYATSKSVQLIKKIRE
jgi:hypothetical protein